jgi:putative ABC transport system substrate-binding protein
MDRRRFLLTSLAGTLAIPLAAEAQPSTTISRIGLLTDLAWEPLREGLHDLGYAEGKNILFELRRSEGRSERWPALAAELVRLKVDVIVTQGTPATLAAKQATTTIPIVMIGTGDPLTTGLIASLAQPGGNVTGSSQLGAGLATKRLEILKETVRTCLVWPSSGTQRIRTRNRTSTRRRLERGPSMWHSSPSKRAIAKSWSGRLPR